MKLPPQAPGVIRDARGWLIPTRPRDGKGLQPNQMVVCCCSFFGQACVVMDEAACRRQGGRCV